MQEGVKKRNILMLCDLPCMHAFWCVACGLAYCSFWLPALNPDLFRAATSSNFGWD